MKIFDNNKGHHNNKMKIITIQSREIDKGPQMWILAKVMKTIVRQIRAD